MHVETYNIKYRAQECQDVKEEPGMYLGEENQVYVQGGYQPVFDMSPQSQSQQHCDQQFAYTIRWETARPVQEIHYTSYFTPSYSGSSSEALKYSHHLPSSGDYRHGELEHTNYTGNQYPPLSPFLSLPVVDVVTPAGGGVTEQLARHTPPPPYTNTSYSSFSPCSSSSASLSPPIAVSSRSEISSSPVKNKYNRRNNPELEKRRTHHCDFLGCTKVYTKSSHLKAHQRIHTGGLSWNISVTSLIIRQTSVKFLIKSSISKTSIGWYWVIKLEPRQINLGKTPSYKVLIGLLISFTAHQR